MYETLLKLCESKGIKITKLCIDITGSPGNLGTWKKGNINPSSLVKIADYFGVSTDYLLGRTDKTENNIAINNPQNYNGTQNNGVIHTSVEKSSTERDTIEEEFISVFKHLNIMDKVAVMQFAFDKMQKSA